MGFFVEVALGGLMAGVLYSLVALGFVLIFKASGVFNFAQGAMVLFAALSLARLAEWIPQWMPSLASVAPHVPRELASAVDRALARDPDARFPTARAFAQALRTALGWPADSGRSPLRSPPLTSNVSPA